MARRRKGDPVHGWVNVDKPVGPTSNTVVGIVRRLFNAQKAGHAGTLDPLASGILPIALGEATKTVPHLVDAHKTYRFTVRWGEATSTDDREGAVVAESPVRPDGPAIERELVRFVGEIEQVPPAYSAIKIDGQRAYKLARQGQEVAVPPRKVRIYTARLLDLPDRDHARLEIECGKGTYVRALARDLAQALGTCGHVTELRRTALGPFTETDAIPLDILQEFGHSAPASGPLWDALRPLQTALDDIPALALSEPDASRLQRGQAVMLRGRDAPVLTGTVLALCRGNPVALTTYSQGELRPFRIFNLNSTQGVSDVDYA